MIFRNATKPLIAKLAFGFILLALSAACGDPPNKPPTQSIPPTVVPTSASALAPTAVSAATPTPPTATPTSVPTPTPEPTATPIVATPRPVPSVRPTPDPRSRGGVLNLSSQQNIAHQDVQQDASPALTSWGPGIAYSRLMRLDTDVPTPSMSLECDICADWTMESPTSYLFDLRDDIEWHDLAPVGGRPVNAEDVIFSYQRQSSPDFPNAALTRNIVALEYLGPHTLRIRFKLPDADSLLSLADGHSKIVAPEVAPLDGDIREGPTIGSGPWIFDNASPDGFHVFSRNPDYFEPALPLADGLKIMILTDDDTRSAAFQTGMIDIHEMNPQEWEQHIQRLPNAPVLEIPQPRIGIEVAFKTTAPPFDDARARRAVMLSLDPVRLIAEQWEGFGFVGAGFPVASPNWLLPESDISARFNDSESAKSLLRDVGTASRDPVTITVGDFGQSRLDYAHAVSTSMQSVGFDTRVEIVNRRQFGENVWLQGDYQIMVGPPAPISTPNGYLLTALHSDGAWNSAGHSDQALDAMIEAQAIETDPVKRTELIHRIQNHTLDQGYRFMPFSRVAIWTWQPYVRDFHPNFALSEYHHWSKVWIEK